MAMYLIGGDVAIWNDARKARSGVGFQRHLQYVRGRFVRC